jgi:glycerol-3-phosphate dehydrogenase (NAD(P)+)
MALSVAVIGAGAWGLALAAAAARASGSAMLYSRKPLGTPPAGVTLVGDMKDVGAGARIVVLAVPSGVAREVARQLGDHIDGRHFVVHGIRGLSGPNLDPVSEVVRQETPARRVGALGGPALAEDLLAGKPSVLVCGSAFPEVSSAVAEAFGSRALRVYTTTDLRGLEWASALVGCLAIGIGLAQEAGVSPGLVAAVISRGVEEAARIAEAAGGEERTLLGLAGGAPWARARPRDAALGGRRGSEAARRGGRAHPSPRGVDEEQRRGRAHPRCPVAHGVGGTASGRDHRPADDQPDAQGMIVSMRVMA